MCGWVLFFSVSGVYPSSKMLAYGCVLGIICGFIFHGQIFLAFGDVCDFDLVAAIVFIYIHICMYTNIHTHIMCMGICLYMYGMYTLPRGQRRHQIS